MCARRTLGVCVWYHIETARRQWRRGGRGRRRRRGRRGRRRWGRRRRRWGRQGRRLVADGSLKPLEIARELVKVLYADRLGRVGSDHPQRREAHLIPEAPREHGDAAGFDEPSRVDGRLRRRLARRCELITLLAVREEQHDLSRPRAAIGEEQPSRFEAGGYRGLAVRVHLVDCRVDLDIFGRPSHARRCNRCEGHHREAHRVHAEGVVAHQKLGKGL